MHAPHASNGHPDFVLTLRNRERYKNDSGAPFGVPPDSYLSPERCIFKKGTL
jgi:hypothetical protein